MKVSLLVESILLVTATYAAVLPFDEWPHQRISLPNVSIHFRYAGSGPPLFLVHGNPQHSVCFPTTFPS